MHTPLIKRCLELALNGRGKISPNPLVGCVIVKNGEVIAEGWHEKFGEEHAERIVLGNAGKHAKGGALYVNLEPCCKEGKQPPCTDAIIKAGIRTVIFGARDLSNAGAEILRSKGIEVIGSVLEAECRRLNRGFFSLIEKGRPWVTLKKAMTRDGRVASPEGEPRLLITSDEQNAWAHRNLRATHDAILVGSGTIIADNPKLNVRHGTKNYQLTTNNFPPPRRVILDPHYEVPADATVLTDEDSNRTLLIHEKLPIPDLLTLLKAEGITSILVEGGLRVWKSFEESACVDEVVILVGT